MTQLQINKIVIERANEMLKDEKINSIYQSFEKEEKAKEWIIKSALTTLMIPVEEREKLNQDFKKIQK